MLHCKMKVILPNKLHNKLFPFPIQWSILVSLALERWDLAWKHNLSNQIIVFVVLMYVWHIAELVIEALRKYLFIIFNIWNLYICFLWLMGA